MSVPSELAGKYGSPESPIRAGRKEMSHAVTIRRVARPRADPQGGCLSKLAENTNTNFCSPSISGV